MATSGTYNFNLDIDEVIQEATEMIGGEETLGHTPASARRSINLMLNEWQNKGVLLWSILTTAVTATSVETSLSDEILDTLAVTYAVSAASTDLALERISREEYHNLPNKTTTGRPTQYAITRGVNNIALFLYPTPNITTGILNIECFKQLEDVTKSAGQNAQVPKRFLPALTCGLSYHLAMKRPGIPMDRIQMLKANYDEKLAFAMEEDRERASMFIKPKLGYI
jgi:hypothetical protein|tara:strand:+ start:360 stop:1034 length:675 start_codon:yes stop_codon:yes gene_type:complete